MIKSLNPYGLSMNATHWTYKAQSTILPPSRIIDQLKKLSVLRTEKLSVFISCSVDEFTVEFV